MALMLEARPTLTVTELREILWETATPPAAGDGHLSLPNSDWGVGKLNWAAETRALGANARGTDQKKSGRA